jgi:CRISPR-associated endonuclease/helicase Cas3
MELNVKGFSIDEVANPFPQIPFQKIRSFQKEFIENAEEFDIISLSAPTGAGKTLCFEYLCKTHPPVLLVYPTTALMADQERQLKEHGIKVFRLDSQSLGEARGYERSRKLIAIFMAYDIIITNPDILSAILHRLYNNPEEDLLRTFRYPQYIIFDEFHVFEELELSDILLQILCYLGLSKSKIVLSSATPTLELFKVLNTIQPECKVKEINVRGIEGNIPIRYDTHVTFLTENFKRHVPLLIEECIKKNRKTLVICNSSKFIVEMFNDLCSKGFESFVTSDTGYETRGDIKADLSKLIILSTAKSEVGIDYPIDTVIIDTPLDIQSFIQRFGRVARKKEGEAYIYTKKIPLLEREMSYTKFVETMKSYLFEDKINEKILKTLLEYRAYLFIRDYNYQKQVIEQVISPLKWKKYYGFFKDLSKAEEQLKQLQIENKDFQDLMKFLDDYNKGLHFLRGQSLTTRTKYQRGFDWSYTFYSLLHSLNNYEIDIEDGSLILLKPTETPRIHSLTYNGEEYDYYKFDSQMKEDINKKLSNIEDLGLIKNEAKYILQELIRVDLKKIILPEKVTLKDGTIIGISDFVKNIQKSENADFRPDNII